MIGVLWMACAVDYGVQGPGDTPDLPPTLPPTVPIVEEPVSIDASTRGTGFWIGFMENIRLGTNGEPVFDVSAYADAPGTLTVSLPNTGYTDTVTVSPGWNDVALPASVLYAEGSDVVGRWGVRVESDVEVDLVAHHRRVFFSESSLVLPDGELGTRYRIQALAPPPDDDTGRGGFVVVATDDGTTVELTLSDVSTAAFPAGSPYTVELDAGETYQVLSQGDLSGSLVTADAPVAVFAGGADTWAGCPATSHAWEQLAPVDRWGREHLVVPFAGQGGDLVRIVADGPTTVQLDCDETVELEEGGVWTGLATAPLRVTSSAPVGVIQVSRGGDCTTTALGDANAVAVPPLALYRDGASVYPIFDAAELAEPHWLPGRRAARQGYSVARGLPGQEAADDGLLDDRPVQLEGPVRGVVFAVGIYDAHTFGLGWDCLGCATDLSAEPSCPPPEAGD